MSRLLRCSSSAMAIAIRGCRVSRRVWNTCRMYSISLSSHWPPEPPLCASKPAGASNISAPSLADEPRLPALCKSQTHKKAADAIIIPLRSGVPALLAKAHRLVSPPCSIPTLLDASGAPPGSCPCPYVPQHRSHVNIVPLNCLPLMRRGKRCTLNRQLRYLPESGMQELRRCHVLPRPSPGKSRPVPPHLISIR